MLKSQAPVTSQEATEGTEFEPRFTRIDSPGSTPVSGVMPVRLELRRLAERGS
jgi:hypothetical protein